VYNCTKLTSLEISDAHQSTLMFSKVPQREKYDKCEPSIKHDSAEATRRTALQQRHK
jgi:hypothetical protein